MRINRTKIIIPVLALVLMVAGTAFGQGAPRPGALVASGPRTVGANPLAPAGIFPLWYMDSFGVALEACLDGSPFCLGSTPADLTDPAGVGEAFYWMASADLGPAPSLFEMALEMAFVGAIGNPDPLLGGPQVFNRLRVRMFGLLAGGDHTISHPFGELVVPTIPGRTPGTFDINFTDDFGGGFVGEQSFAAVLQSPYAGPFLASVSIPPPPGYIGSAAPSTVTGGTVRNDVSIAGPGVNDTNDHFTVIGKFTTNGGLTGPKATFSRTALDPGKKIVTVKAKSVGNQLIKARFGPNPIPKPKFRQTLLPGAIKAAGVVYSATATFGANAVITPIQVKNRSSIPPTIVSIPNIVDKVTITSATRTTGAGATLTVNATSTDELAALLVVDAPTGTPIGTGAVNTPLPITGIPPLTVRVESSSGGTKTATVVVTP